MDQDQNMRISRRNCLQCAAGGTLAAASRPLAAAGTNTAADPAAFLAIFAQRQTVRRYRMDPVPDEHVRQIIDAARRGPTCMNQQPWKFLVVRNRETIDAMKKRTLELIAKSFEAQSAPNPKSPDLEARKAKAIHFTEGYFTAPVYVAVLVDSSLPCSGYGLQHDGPIAAAYLMIAARAFGYGTAYLTDGIPERVTREVLAIPDRYKRICITPIGVPDGWPPKTSKRKLEDVIAYETLKGAQPYEPIPYNP